MQKKNGKTSKAESASKHNRRSVLGLGVGALGGFFIGGSRRAAAADRLVVTNFGGVNADQKRRNYYEPFSRETGIEVVEVQSTDIARIRAQVESGNVEWDVCEMVDSWLPLGERLNLFEPIDESIVDRSSLPASTRRALYSATYHYGAGLAFPTDRFEPAAQPKTWQDFWDVEKFPGRRGLRTRIGETLEIALLADGVPADQVYPCDVERGFAALDRIKPHITHWIGTTAQTTVLIQNNECDFTYTYVSIVKLANQAGIPINISYDSMMMGTQWLAVLRGTRNKEAAMRYLAFTLRRDRQIAMCNDGAFVPLEGALFDELDEQAKVWVPDPRRPGTLFLQPDWWADKLDPLNQRYQEWMLR